MIRSSACLVLLAACGLPPALPPGPTGTLAVTGAIEPQPIRRTLNVLRVFVADPAGAAIADADPVAVTEPAGRIVRVNPALTRFNGSR